MLFLFNTFSRQFSRIIQWNKIQISHYCSTQYAMNLKVRGVSLQKYIEHLQKEYEKANSEDSYISKQKLIELQPVIEKLIDRKCLVDNIQNLTELLNEKDEDIRKLAQEEQVIFEQEVKALDEELFEAILPRTSDDFCNSIVVEVNTGVGGQEAMLFASELFEMYSNFAQYKGWETQVAAYTTTDLGGIRHGSLLINGEHAFRYFRHEAGVHRVQRIPATEKAGRIHTSTVSVVTLPQPTDIEINLETKDLKIDTKRASGAGGQHVNTTDSAVRIVHIPSGLSVECQVDRSQLKNKQIALTKLKALLYQRELEEHLAKDQATRKRQVRSNFRNEKIRTYNFPQDRITDHRLQGCNFHNLKGFLEGNAALEALIHKLDNEFKVELLLDIVNNLDSK